MSKFAFFAFSLHVLYCIDIFPKSGIYITLANLCTFDMLAQKTTVLKINVLLSDYHIYFMSQSKLENLHQQLNVNSIPSYACYNILLMGLWILNELYRRNKFLYGFADQKVKIIRIFMMNILWINRRHLLWKKVMLFLALLPKIFGFCLELFSSYLYKTLVVIFLMLSLIELNFLNVPSVLHSWNKYHAVMVFIHFLCYWIPFACFLLRMEQ